MRRTAFKGRKLFQGVLCRLDYAERVVAIFSRQIQSEHSDIFPPYYPDCIL